MKSLVIVLIEHGETTDPLAEFIDGVRMRSGVEDYDLQVDVNTDEEFTVDFTGETVYLRRHSSPSAQAFRELERGR